MGHQCAALHMAKGLGKLDTTEALTKKGRPGDRRMSDFPHSIFFLGRKRN
jgi:hypothetical protein